jgi:hypothetical protein
MLLGSGQTSRWRASVWLEQVAHHCNEAVFSCKAIFSFLRIGVVTVVQVTGRDRFEPGSTNQDFGEPGSMKCSLGSRPCLLNNGFVRECFLFLTPQISRDSRAPHLASPLDLRLTPTGDISPSDRLPSYP